MKVKVWTAWKYIRRFFPLVLLVHHVKHSLIGLLYGLVLLGIITDFIGKSFGLSFLFLSPEYREEVSWASFLILGFSFGGFIMAFHTYSYTKLASNFPFLAMVNKPFLKFCINNSLLPLVFTLIYLSEMTNFQFSEEFASVQQVSMYILSLLGGMALFITVAVMFFFRKNKNMFELTRFPKSPRRKRWERIQNGRNFKWKVSEDKLYYYFGTGMRLMQCRSTKHYQQSLLQQVFAQNRISTSVFELTTVLAFLFLGFLGGSRWFDIPAAGSIVLLLTIILMLFNALASWLRWYAVPCIIAVLLLVNWFSESTEWFQFRTEAIGMDYKQKADYSIDAFQTIATDTLQNKADLKAYIQVLDNWKKQTGKDKPKLVIVNTSGGGSRSAAWVYWVLSQMDESSNYGFTKHTAMITGASGGMIGASFYRALYLQKIRKQIGTTSSEKYYEQITSDLLNRLSFTASTNDIFVRYQTSYRGVNGYNYDRGIAFEEDLNENTNYVLDVPFGAFAEPEKQGKIPVMLFTPCVVNDGRRLVFSSQPTSFMNNQDNIVGLTPSYENIDAQRLLGKEQVENVKFSSVLRMNATFPLVLPMTTLPTNPKIQIMDAGTRDNFGAKETIYWLMALEDWIKRETSGVVLVQIRDTKKIFDKEGTRHFAFFDKILEPFGNLFSNFPRTQDFDQDELIQTYAKKVPFPFQVVSFNLRQEKSERISLSWHLTKRERKHIRDAWNKDANAVAKTLLLKLLKED